MLTRIYQEVLGRNVFTIHPKCQGCSHTKLFVIRYPGYLMVVITSANTMVLDMELCDNVSLSRLLFDIASSELRLNPSAALVHSDLSRNISRSRRQTLLGETTTFRVSEDPPATHERARMS